METYQELRYVAGRSRTTDVYAISGKKIIIEGTFIKTARLKDEYESDVSEPDVLIQALVDFKCRADIFTFWDRVPTGTKHPYFCEPQIQALLPVESYELWWRSLDRRVRKIVRRSVKRGVHVRIAKLDDNLLRGIKEIYDESPIKRNKPFWHYNKSIDELRIRLGQDSDISEFIVAFYGGEVIGFIKMIYRDKFADPVLFIAKMLHSRKYPSNLLIAKAVERCAEKGLPFIHYSDWRIGTHGDFLRRNGFRKFRVNRYYVPLTGKGKLALQLGIHKSIRSRIPEWARIRLQKVRGTFYRLHFRLIGKKLDEIESEVNR
jgi:hypothetical protein